MNQPQNIFEDRPKPLKPRMLRVLPSLFTLGNLICGFAAIFNASRAELHDSGISHLAIASSLIFAGMVFDALDGRIARMTGQTSTLGEHLDSMADMVTFGVAPAFILIQLVGIGNPLFGETHLKWNVYFERFVIAVAAVYVACTALRLARFNAELERPGQSDHLTFKGLPSPAAAGTVCALVLLHQWQLGRRPGGVSANDFGFWADATSVALVFITLLNAMAMVSTTRYSHVANRFFRDLAPIHYVGWAVFLLIPLVTDARVTLAAVFVGYALSGPLALLYRKLRKRKPVVVDGQETAPEESVPRAEDDAPPLRINHP